jgi:hypothetical protein
MWSLVLFCYQLYLSSCKLRKGGYIREGSGCGNCGVKGGYFIIHFENLLLLTWDDELIMIMYLFWSVFMYIFITYFISTYNQSHNYSLLVLERDLFFSCKNSSSLVYIYIFFYF